MAQDAAPAAEGPVVERVEVQGNQYLAPETFLFYVSSKAGDRYDERRLKEDFRRVWDTGFVEDLVLHVFDGRQGKVVIFRVSERKRVQVVDYRGSKELTNTEIEDTLKEKDAALRIDSFYDPAKAERAADIIKEKLGAEGRPFGEAKVDAKSIGPSGMQVSFVIEDGPKAKVKSVSFDGNEVFSDDKLRGQMKKLKHPSFTRLTWLTGKSTYTGDKWADPSEGDRQRLETFYLDQGYVTASIGEPQVTYSDGKAGFFKKKPVKWLHLNIPVAEGDQYRVGEVKFEGLTVFKEEGIRPLFKLAAGEVYRESRVRKGEEKLRDFYGSQGYFQWTMRTERKPDPARKVVDVNLVMEEDKRYYVGKIIFSGNSTTRDKVIRREVYLNEGDVFNTEALKLSIRRINQLGYFKPMEKPPQITQSGLAEDKLDLGFRVEEQNRNQFTFGGGVSGLEGTFVNASFSTANFLGLGETFQVSAQSGRRTKNYQVAITEPYLFDRPITAGIDVFSRRIQFETQVNVVGFSQEETGASLVVGLPLGRFSRVFTNYTYQVVEIRDLQGINQPEEPDEGGPIFDPFLGQVGRRRESRLTPSVVHNTVDNPYTPRSGVKLSANLPVAGGPLGGTLDYFRPTLEAVAYIPHLRRTSLGLRGEVQWVKAYGDTDILPYYLRIFMGGETQIRGYNVRTVGPLDPTNRTALGGTKSVLFNAEYYFDIAGPLRALLFFDAGQAFLESQKINLKDLRTSTGVEVRFIMPVV
ncbi:MAG: outer membrane protein assembly factor BamA, partial [Acidobacteria bacterium]|nr:outer membrane protein assembly factor BamA [Acidobacteriota bacterium]